MIHETCAIRTWRGLSKFRVGLLRDRAGGSPLLNDSLAAHNHLRWIVSDERVNF